MGRSIGPPWQANHKRGSCGACGRGATRAAIERRMTPAAGGDIAAIRRRGVCFTAHQGTWSPTMGDRSPKSMRKQTDQKQARTTEDNRKKQAAVVAKQVPGKRK